MTDTRERIAAAFERELEKSPVPPGLRAQVLREKVRDRKDLALSDRQPARNPWLVGLRGVGSLAAVLLVVVLIATVLVGGQVRRDWNQFIARPAPAAGVDPAQLALLEARPLSLPVVPPGATCPMGPKTTIEYGGGPLDAYGSGPVYAFESGGSWQGSTAPSFYADQWGGYWGMKVFAPPAVTGPVLIRARDIQAGNPIVFVGQFASGDVVGSDTVAGKKMQQHVELALDTSQPPYDTTVGGLRVWEVIVGEPHTPVPDLCAGFQLDGLNFTEVFVAYYGG